MRFTVTGYDEDGNPAAAEVVDLAALRERLARAAETGEHLHVRPQEADGCDRVDRPT